MPTIQVYSILGQAKFLGFDGWVSFHRLSEPFLDKRTFSFALHAKSYGFKVKEYTNGDVLRAMPELCEAIDGIIDELVIGIYDNPDERWQHKFEHTKVRLSYPPRDPWIRDGAKYAETAKRDPSIAELPCHRNTGLLIRYDGRMSLCCEDDACNFDLGNAFETSIDKLWWSEKHMEILRTLAEPGGRYRYPHCSRCQMK